MRRLVAALVVAGAARLREYLLKGGFLWADDFWGDYAWVSFARTSSGGPPATIIQRDRSCSG